MTDLQFLSIVIRFILDSFLTILFFRKLEDISKFHSLLGLLCFIPTWILFIPIGFPVYPDSAFLRYIIRAFSVFAYLLVAKKGGKRVLLYDSLLFCLCLTLCQNLFMTPLLSELRNVNITVSGSPLTDMLFARMVEYLITGLIIWGCASLFRIQDIMEVGWLRLGICLLMAAINILVKHILRMTYNSDPSANIFPLFISLVTLMILLFTEYYMNSVQKNYQARMALAVQRNQYDALKTTVKLDENTRRLRHDMKNHIIALRAMVNEPDKLNEYLNDMYRDLDSSMYGIRTGNNLLDALLEQKYQYALSKKVKVTYNIDFSNVGFLRDFDLNTIVGNAMDNAIEAAAEVPDEEKRTVVFKSAWKADMLILKFENHYFHEPEIRDGIFVTRKEDNDLHGYGLKNIRKTAERYDGNVVQEVLSDKLFRLVILLPSKE